MTKKQVRKAKKLIARVTGLSDTYKLQTCVPIDLGKDTDYMKPKSNRKK